MTGQRSTERDSRALLEEKLEFLRKPDPIAADPDQAFKLQEAVQEMGAKLAAIDPRPQRTAIDLIKIIALLCILIAFSRFRSRSC